MDKIIDVDYLASSSAHAYKVYKPNKRKSSKSLPQLPKREAYDHYVSKLNETYTKIETRVFSELASQLAEYVGRVHDIYTSGQVSAYRYTQCAIVTMSININDLTCLYEMLFSKIQSITSMTITINSDRVKSISDFVKVLHEACTEFMGLNENEIPYNFYSTLAQFYEGNNSKLPLVVVFEDFDCFNANLLTDLLLLIQENLSKMPLLLICCQSTDILPLNMRLPSKATDSLKVEHFSFRATVGFFNQLISDICWDHHSSFKLGPKTISHITEVYKIWDTSLRGAFRRVKLCLFEHFYNQKVAKLCCPTDLLDETIKNLTDDELTSVRELPSVEGHKLPKDNATFRESLKTELRAFCDYLEGIQVELRLYHHIKEFAHPEETFTFLMSTWITFLDSEKYSESDDFFFLSQRLITFGKGQIKELMHRLSVTDESGPSDIYKALSSHFKDFDAKTFEGPPPSELKENKLDPQKRTRGSNGISSPRKQMPTMSRNDLKQLLIKESKRVNKLKIWMDEFLDILKKELDKIQNPLHAKYHEIFFFDDIDLVKQYNIPNTRQDILSSLKNPEKILNCKCCRTLGPNSPDLTIVYAIYCDNLRVANLKKCYDIFKEIVTQADSSSSTRASPRKKAKKEQPKFNEKQILSRFNDAIGDLEYLGLLRAHPRKVDHIERLVWEMDVNSDAEYSSDDQMSQMSQNLNAINITTPKTK